MDVRGRDAALRGESGVARGRHPAATERLDKHVLAHQPDLLLISYGLNDARGGTPLPLFAEALESIIDTVRKKIAPLIVLLGPYYMTSFDGYGPDWNHGSLDFPRLQ